MRLTKKYYNELVKVIMKRWPGVSESFARKYVDEMFNYDGMGRHYLQFLAEVIIPEAFEAGGAKMHDDLSGASTDFEYEGELSPNLDQFLSQIIEQNKE